MDFDWNCLLGNFQLSQLVWAGLSGLSLFAHHVVRDVKSDAQEKLFVLTKFSRFIGLYRVSVM